jgi:uncharacterized protein (DUF1330 family)
MAQHAVDALNDDALAAFSARGADGPVVMLNLLEFVPDGGADRYGEYGAAVAPLLEKVGGRLLWSGAGAETLIGNGRWDLVLLVEYPSRKALLDMVGSPEYQAIIHLRSDALLRSELRALEPIDAVVG